MAEPTETGQLTPAIETRIYSVRGLQVMLSPDLADLYGVQTKVLMQAVRRNQGRFPDDFAFQLTNQEVRNLKSHFVTSSWGGTRYPPHAFTEQGVAMLSSVLRSPQAVAVNIEIMRTFVRMRRFAETIVGWAKRSVPNNPMQCWARCALPNLRLTPGP